MRAQRSKGMWSSVARKTGLALLSVAMPAGAQVAAAQAAPQVGVACTVGRPAIRRSR